MNPLEPDSECFLGRSSLLTCRAGAVLSPAASATWQGRVFPSAPNSCHFCSQGPQIAFPLLDLRRDSVFASDARDKPFVFFASFGGAKGGEGGVKGEELGSTKKARAWITTGRNTWPMR